jgi:prevent-host-death family protein
MRDEPIVPSGQLRAHLAEHLDRVCAGEEFVITRNGRATAKLTPVLEETTDDD